MHATTRTTRVLLGILPKLPPSTSRVLEQAALQAADHGIEVSLLLNQPDSPLERWHWQPDPEPADHAPPDLPPQRRQVWIERRAVMFDYGHDKAARWYQRQQQLAARILHSGPPEAFFCWNRACCLQGCLAELLESSGVPAGTIEWGCLPDSLLITARPQNFRGWTCADPLDSHDGAASPPAPTGPVKAAAGLYRQSSPELEGHEAVIAGAGRTGPRIVCLGFSEVDSFAFPPRQPEARTYLPFSDSCLDLARQASAANPDGITVFKPHPMHDQLSPGRVDERLWVVEGDPEIWLDWADLVIASGSKLELTAAVAGKPVICVGGGLLWGSGLAAEVATEDQLRQAVTRPPAPATGDDIRLHLTRVAGQELLLPQATGGTIKPLLRSLDRIRKRRDAGSLPSFLKHITRWLPGRARTARARAPGHP